VRQRVRNGNEPFRRTDPRCPIASVRNYCCGLSTLKDSFRYNEAFIVAHFGEKQSQSLLAQYGRDDQTHFDIQHVDRRKRSSLEWRNFFNFAI
jgi:hypothetical protein